MNAIRLALDNLSIAAGRLAAMQHEIAADIDADEVTLDAWPADGTEQRDTAVRGVRMLRDLRHRLAQDITDLDRLRDRLKAARALWETLPPNAAELRAELETTR